MTACHAMPALADDAAHAAQTEDDSARVAVTDIADAPPKRENKLKGDHLVVAVGVGYTPDYNGSDEYKVRYGGAFRGEFKGIGFASKGIGVEFDVAPDIPGPIGLSLGPTIRYRANRTGSVKDPVVDLLPDLKHTLEVGVAAGISVKGVLIKQDKLSAGGDIRWDVSGHSGGRIIDTSINYVTPLGEGIGVALSVGMDFIDDDYADYFFTVTPEMSEATDFVLPVYQAKGGPKNRTARAYFGFDFDGNFRNGGFVGAASIGYSQMRGSSAETPITALRGSRNQYSALAAVGYIF